MDDTTSPESEEPVVYGLFEINCRDTNGEQVRFVVDFKTAARLADDLAMWTDER